MPGSELSLGTAADTNTKASKICPAQSRAPVRRRRLASRAVTRAVVVITAVSFLVCFIGSSLLQTPGRPASPGLVALGWWGGWSGDAAVAEQCGADEQGGSRVAGAVGSSGLTPSASPRTA